jgi:hypothetical protein
MKPEYYENYDSVSYILFESGVSAIAAVKNKYKLEVGRFDPFIGHKGP